MGYSKMVQQFVTEVPYRKIEKMGQKQYKKTE